jgi:hypothetical protein
MRSALLALAVLGLSPTDSLVYRPRAELRLEREFATHFELRLSDWNVVMNGQDVPAQYLPKLAIESRTNLGFTARDEVLAARDGKLLAVRREYRELAGSETSNVTINGERDAASGEESAKPSIGACTVLFDERKDAASERRKLEAGEVDAEALAALELDLDYTRLLPPEGDDEWELEVAQLHPFGRRLAGIAFAFEARDDDRGAPQEQLAANARGHWRLARGEEREENGQTLCVVQLEGEFETEATRRTELVDVPVASGAADEHTELTLELSGELVWNATQGVLHSLEWSGEGAMTVRTVRVRDGSGADTAYEHTLNFACKSSFGVSARVE